MELFHVFNRGVDRRTIFSDNQDHVRFVHDLYEFNDTTPARNLFRQQMCDLRCRTSRETLVHIHGWCLMGNHYHLLLSEVKEGGLTAFIKKLNIGYAKYFNERYERVGTLFQGRTKKVLIEREAHFLHILHYIHLNPLDFLKGSQDWRELKIRDRKKALEHLAGYRWSSYNDYCGTKNFPSILTRDIFEDVFPDYKKAVTAYIRDIDVNSISELTLE